MMSGANAIVLRFSTKANFSDSGSTMVTLPRNSMPTAISCAEHADDDPLDHEGPADEPIGRADELMTSTSRRRA